MKYNAYFAPQCYCRAIFSECNISLLDILQFQHILETNLISQGKTIPGEVHSIEKASSTAQGFVARSIDQAPASTTSHPTG
jgi:hypothetical protein